MRYSAILVLLLLLTSSVLSIGVTPPRIIIDDALKGSVISKSVKLVDIKAGEKVSISLSGEGSQWISLPKSEEFIVSDSNGEEIPFILSLPQEAPNADYKVRAQITTQPNNQGQSGSNTASVVSGIMVEITFTVTGNQIKKYSVRNVQIPHTEVGLPITVVSTIKNEGNILVKPSKVELVIKDKETKNVLQTKSATPANSAEPFSTQRIATTFPNTLSKDLYFADVSIFDGEDIIHEEKEIPFDVLARGSLDAQATLQTLEVQENVQDLAKISASLQNTGKIAIHATLNLEIYKDDILFDTVKTEEVFVEKDQLQEFIAQYAPQEKGEYVVKAYATFLGKKSNAKETSFTANPSTKSNSNTWVIVLVGVLFFIGIVLQIVILKRNKKTHHAILHQNKWSTR